MKHCQLKKSLDPISQPRQEFDGVSYLDCLDGFTKAGPGVGRELKVKSFFHLGMPIYIYIFFSCPKWTKKLAIII
jgi:hypothetical protein